MGWKVRIAVFCLLLLVSLFLQRHAEAGKCVGLGPITVAPGRGSLDRYALYITILGRSLHVVNIMQFLSVSCKHSNCENQIIEHRGVCMINYGKVRIWKKIGGKGVTPLKTHQF